MCPQKQVNSSNTAYNWKNKTILLIDNDELNCTVISLFLKPTFCRFICTTNPLEGLNRIKEHSIDLVITELYFKKIYGINLIQQIKEINKSVPVIVQSSLLYENEKEDYLRAGCDFYFTKPFDFKQFMQIIDTYMKS